MTKKELISAMAEKSGLTKKDTESAYAAFVSVVEEQLKVGDKVQLIGFGNFETSKRAAKTGRNPKTGEELTIKSSICPKFKASKALKDSLN